MLAINIRAKKHNCVYDIVGVVCTIRDTRPTHIRMYHIVDGLNIDSLLNSTVSVCFDVWYDGLSHEL